MNCYYSRDIAINTLENYMNQIDKMDEEHRKSYLKVYKALKDSITLLKTFSDMNEQESNEYFRLLMACISTSMLIK